MNDVEREMPRYRSNDKAWALKIAKLLNHDDGTTTIQPEDDGYAPFQVDTEFVINHGLEVGSYYVVHNSGHKTAMIAPAFEASYSKMGPSNNENSPHGVVAGTKVECVDINTEKVVFYCKNCQVFVRVKQVGTVDPKIKNSYADLVCEKCHYLIATFESSM